MNPIDIISEFYTRDSKAYEIIIDHGRQVAAKACAIAKKMVQAKPDLQFIQEAAMLHDIGIFMTNSPELGCTGDYPYVCHGYLGRELLDNKGLFRHALVCERHVGVGISAEEIKRRRLPLPLRDMMPVTMEEEIICFADKFYSKNGAENKNETSAEDILRNLERYGYDKVKRFQKWIEMFA
jgi:uncharacterized protein